LFSFVLLKFSNLEKKGSEIVYYLFRAKPEDIDEVTCYNSVHYAFTTQVKFCARFVSQFKQQKILRSECLKVLTCWNVHRRVV